MLRNQEHNFNCALKWGHHYSCRILHNLTDISNSFYVRKAKYYAVGHAMTRGISWRPLIVDGIVLFQASPCRICGGQSEAERSVSITPPPLVLYHQCFALIISFINHRRCITLAIDSVIK